MEVWAARIKRLERGEVHQWQGDMETERNLQAEAADLSMPVLGGSNIRGPQSPCLACLALQGN